MAHKSRYQLAEDVKQLAARDGIGILEAKRRVEQSHLIEDINELADDKVKSILLRIVRLMP